MHVALGRTELLLCTLLLKGKKSHIFWARKECHPEQCQMILATAKNISLRASCFSCRSYFLTHIFRLCFRTQNLRLDVCCPWICFLLEVPVLDQLCVPLLWVIVMAAPINPLASNCLRNHKTCCFQLLLFQSQFVFQMLESQILHLAHIGQPEIREFRPLFQQLLFNFPLDASHSKLSLSSYRAKASSVLLRMQQVCMPGTTN